MVHSKNLPPELWYMIMERVDAIDRPNGLRPEPLEELARIQTLHACALLNRALGAYAKMLLYSTFVYDKHSINFGRMWVFLRTMFENLALRNYVQHLDVREALDSPKPNSALTPSLRQGGRADGRTKASIFEAATDLGFSQSTVESAFVDEDLTVFANVLVSLMTNLESLSLSMGFYYELRIKGRNLTGFLAEPSSFSKLTQITVSRNRPSLIAWSPYSWIYTLPLFGIASVHRLNMFDVDVCHACVRSAVPYLLDKHLHGSYGTSNVQHLTVVPSHHFRFGAGLHALLKIPKTLVSLTLGLSRPLSTKHPRDGIIDPNDAFWRFLCSHSATLKYLDFYQPDYDQHDDQNMEFSLVGSFRDFPCLETLRIPFQTLLGRGPHAESSKHRFTAVLPPALYSFTVYASQDVFSSASLRMVYKTALKVLLRTKSFPRLKYIFLEKSVHLESTDFRNMCESRKTNDLYCDNGITIRVLPWDSLPKGGLNLQSSTAAHDPEKDVERHLMSLNRLTRL